MGYYTYYNILIRHKDLETRKRVCEELVSKCDMEDVDDTEYTYCSTYDKWYSWEEDLNDLSQKYPDVVFDVSGNGEEFDDHWNVRVKNGLFDEAVDIYLPYTKILYDSVDASMKCQQIINVYETLKNSIDTLYGTVKHEYNIGDAKTINGKLKELNRFIIKDGKNHIDKIK